MNYNAGKSMYLCIALGLGTVAVAQENFHRTFMTLQPKFSELDALRQVVGVTGYEIERK